MKTSWNGFPPASSMYEPNPPARPLIHRTRPRRWPWILGTVAGLAAAYVASLVIGFFIWFAAGGTFGGLGESASARMDWDKANALWALWAVVPAVLAFAVPIDWQARRVGWAKDAVSRRRRRWILWTLVTLACVSAFGPGVGYLVGFRWRG